MGNIWETMTMLRAKQNQIVFCLTKSDWVSRRPAGQHCVTDFAQNKQNNKSS